MMITKILGILAIVVGITMIAYSGFSFVTTEEIVDLGPLQISKQDNHSINWPPVVGFVLLAAGIVTIVLTNLSPKKS